MTTGTGKTEVAFQICWKLWPSKWNAKGDLTRKPRIPYLADRNFLVDDPEDKTFLVYHQLGLQHRFTRPYGPQTNGKAERLIQTIPREWA